MRYLVRTREGEALFGPWLSDPKAWATRADMLRIAAHGLAELWRQDWERLEGGQPPAECPYILASLPVLMLAGMALETLAKAVIVRQCGAEWKGRFPRKILGTHAVAPLLDRAGVALTADERELAERMEDLVTWFGKYPVPKRPEDMKFGVPARLEDLEVFSRIYSRVAALLGPEPDQR